MKTYIIDLFNLIHKDNEIKQLFKTDMNNGINAMAAKISIFAAKYTSYKFKLILDGSNYSVSKYSHNIKFVESDHKTADTVIKENISKIKNTSNTIVVSSDTEVYNYARVHACTALLSEEFLNKIIIKHNNTKKFKSKRNNEKPNRVTKKEYQEFLEIFGGNE